MMEIDFKEKMAAKSNDGLLDIIENRQRYIQGAVMAAIDELAIRGHTFSVDELKRIEFDLVQKEKQKEIEAENFFVSNEIENIVKDKNAPEYYSTKTIWGFSAGVTVLFGAILFAMNLPKSNKLGRSIVIGLVLLIPL